MTIEFSTLFSEFGLWLWKTFRFSRGTVSTVRYNPLRCTEYSVWSTWYFVYVWLASHSENNRQWKVKCITHGTDRPHLRHLYCGGKSAAQTLKHSVKKKKSLRWSKTRMKEAIGIEDRGDQRINISNIKSIWESVESKDVVLVAWEPWNRNWEHVGDQSSTGLSSSWYLILFDRRIRLKKIIRYMYICTECKLSFGSIIMVSMFSWLSWY